MTTATAERGTFISVSDVFGDAELPEFVSVPWLAKQLGITRGRIYRAMHDGNLPHIAVESGNPRFPAAYLVRPEDAAVRYGYLKLYAPDNDKVKKG